MRRAVDAHLAPQEMKGAKNMQYQVLCEEDIRKIHGASLRVMEKIGCHIHCDQAKQLLANAGCTIGDDHLVKIPSHVVEEALQNVAKGFVLYDREGSVACTLKGRNSYCGTGVTNTNFHGYQTDERKPTTVQDVANAAKVSDHLEHIKWIMPLGSVQDVPAGVSDVYEFEAAVTNTTKPIVFICHDVRGLKDVLAMAETIAGGPEQLAEKPFIVSYPEPTSPLVHTEHALEKLLYSAERGIPIVYTPCAMAGATAPATMAGVLVQANAECLAGVVLAQLKRKGVPVIVGGVLTILDMSTGCVSYGAPELSLLLAGYADIARHYGLPTWGTAGCSDAKVPDVQAAIEATFSTLINRQAGLSLIHDPGFLENAMIGSLEMLLITNEVMGMTERFLGGIEVSDETLAEDVIASVGPGGNYLEHDHTLRHFREFWQPTLMDRRNYHMWKADGSKTMEQRIREKITDILANHRCKPLPDDVRNTITEIRRRSEKERVVGA